MPKLRLLIRPDCNRACPGCCNKGWRLEDLPICENYSPYSEIMLTGGEPMLDCGEVIRVARAVRAQNTAAPIFVYTAKTTPAHELGWVLSNVSGLTVTLHTPADVEPFLRFADYAALWKLWKGRQLRVNVFRPMQLPETYASLSHWIIKAGMEWIIDCPLPGDEVFMRTAWTTTPETTTHNWTGKA